VKNDEFVMELEENAIDSLAHAIDHYRDFAGYQKSHLKFSILSLFHSIELFLKARLAKAHPILIYEKPESTNLQNAHTVNFKTLCDRLTNTGVDLKTYKANLENLQLIRNQIEHHKFEKKKEEVEGYFVKSIQFLEHFLNHELKIDKRLYSSIAEILVSYDAKRTIAINTARDFLNSHTAEFSIEECRECNEESVVSPSPTNLDDEDEGYCFLCKQTVFRCCQCRHFLSTNQEVGEGGRYRICIDCDGWNAHNNEKY
jgi:hypothetical protein